jgi:hypothetical protein
MVTGEVLKLNQTQPIQSVQRLMFKPFAGYAFTFAVTKFTIKV